DQLSLAIGRRGQNVRLASVLSGWDIDILTEQEESERRQEEFRSRSNVFMEALDIDDVIAHLLVAEGFVQVDDIALTPIEDLVRIEGFDEEIAEELQARAEAFVSAETSRLETRLAELEVSADIGDIADFTLTMLVKLGEAGVKTADDLGDLASDELLEILGDEGLVEDDANAIIMAARASWFEDEDGDALATEDATDAEAHAD
ncbi:MAG: helix-hairpin-helix domain-containing protein, partial [Pseudomonadota bacterium]|nr:helix-hairpin-helix domain-containing protein [Pseudomonadota bacterium]